MLSSPSTQPLCLPNVNANKKQTQLYLLLPQFCATALLSAYRLDTAFHTCLGEQTTGRSRTVGLGELRYAREWSKDTAQA